MSNPTPPANSTPDFIAGWNARAIADGTYVAPPIVPAPPVTPPPPTNVVPIPLGSDLVKALAALKTGQTGQLSAGAYDTPGGITLATSGVKVLGSATGQTTIMKIGKVVDTVIAINSANIEVGNLLFDSDQPLGKPGAAGWNGKVGADALVVKGANSVIYDIKSKNVDDIIFLTATSGGAKITNVSATNELRGDGVYIESTQGATLTNVQIPDGSQNEHAIRLDATSGTTTPPRNITFVNCCFANFDNKESLAVRFGWNITASGCTFGTWVRGGQGAVPGAPPNQDCGNMVFTGNHFLVGAFLEINPYSTGCKVDGNTFDLDTNHVGISIAGPGTDCEFSNNVKNPVNGATAATMKKLIHAFGAVKLSGPQATDVTQS